jgi:hypothetical protein
MGMGMFGYKLKYMEDDKLLHFRDFSSSSRVEFGFRRSHFSPFKVTGT